MSNEDSSREIDKILRYHNSEIVKSILTHTFAGGIIPKDLASLLDSYMSNPSFENASALVKYDPKFIAFFELSKEGGFSEFLFKKGDIK